jgi:hypothetical protein
MPRKRHKEKRTSRRGILIFLFILLFFSVFGGAVYFARYPDWQISEIIITGLERLAPETIRENVEKEIQGNFAFIFPRKSYMLIRADTIKKEIVKDFPRVESVSVTKEFPSKIVVEVKERSFWAVYCVKGEALCGYIDKTGFVYEEAPHSTSLLIRKIESDRGSVVVPSQKFDALFIEKLDMFAEALRNGAREEVGTFLVSEDLEDEFKVETQSGFYLYVKRDDDPEKVVKILKTFLEKEIGTNKKLLEYVDLRFGNKVFYKLQ